MQAEAWVWANWRNIKQVKGVSSSHGMLLLALSKFVPFGSSIEIGGDVIIKLAEAVSSTEGVVRGQLNVLWETGVLSKEGKTLTFPVSDTLVNTEDKKKTSVEVTDEIREVFEHWESTMTAAYQTGSYKTSKSAFKGTKKLTQGRVEIIRRALAQPEYSLQLIKLAITNASKDDFFMKGGYTDLNVILRFDGQGQNNIEYFSDQNPDAKDGKWDITQPETSGVIDL